MRQIQAGNLTAAYQLGEPRVVDVAAQVSRFNVGLPHARDQHHCGDEDYAKIRGAEKGNPARNRRGLIHADGGPGRNITTRIVLSGEASFAGGVV
jgi:hypothetical protein